MHLQVETRITVVGNTESDTHGHALDGRERRVIHRAKGPVAGCLPQAYASDPAFIAIASTVDAIGRRLNTVAGCLATRK